MNHSKIMLVDDQEGITGSQNIDILSFDFNMESGVFFTEPELISELSQVAEDWKKEATGGEVFQQNHCLALFIFMI